MNESIDITKIISGGQAVGSLDSGKKALVWGALPDEVVEIEITKKRSSYVDAVVTNVITKSSERVEPKDPDSYLSTSPWQIMDFAAEQRYKTALIHEAFELHAVTLPKSLSLYSNEHIYEYRNKVEFSFWYDTDTNELSLAFFRRGTHGKIAVDGTSLAMPAISAAADAIVNVLNNAQVGGRRLKTLLLRCDQNGNVSWQLYVKDPDFPAANIFALIVANPTLENGEIIFSNPKSPASVITKRLMSAPDVSLQDTIRDTTFRYATEGFFQVNIPIYEQVLSDIAKWIPENSNVVDLYSGVGTIGLTVTDNNNTLTLVELNEHAVREMKQNITTLKRDDSAKAVLSASEDALDYIQSDSVVIVDPPRAGLHESVIEKLLESAPATVIYLSCNPVTQARDVSRLAQLYKIEHAQGYNFFPRTPHIENLIVLNKT